MRMHSTRVRTRTRTRTHNLAARVPFCYCVCRCCRDARGRSANREACTAQHNLPLCVHVSMPFMGCLLL